MFLAVCFPRAVFLSSFLFTNTRGGKAWKIVANFFREWRNNAAAEWLSISADTFQGQIRESRRKLRVSLCKRLSRKIAKRKICYYEILRIQNETQHGLRNISHYVFRHVQKNKNLIELKAVHKSSGNIKASLLLQFFFPAVVVSFLFIFRSSNVLLLRVLHRGEARYVEYQYTRTEPSTHRIFCRKFIFFFSFILCYYYVLRLVKKQSPTSEYTKTGLSPKNKQNNIFQFPSFSQNKCWKAVLRLTEF